MTQAHANTATVPPQMRSEALRIARQLYLAAEQRTGALDGNGFTEEERIAGALLDAIADELRPALRDADTGIVLGDEPHRFMLTPDARYLRIEAGKLWPVAYSATLARLEPDLRAVLDDLEAAIVEAARPSSAAAAALLREVRAALEGG